MSSPLNPWPWPAPEPGVYFNMPFDQYLAIPALQSSGLKLLLVSGPNFWAESWFNPFRKPRDTVPMKTGRAYHKRVLEGKAAFYSAYAPDYEDDGAPDVLRTGDDIKRALEHLGLPTSFANKTEGAARLLAKAPQKKILDLLIARHRAEYPGREFMEPALVRELELGAKAIECNPHINHWLMGGYPEVTVLFTDSAGVLYKIRFDYLKIGAAADLKTFANEKGKRIDKAIDNAIAGNKYFIQSSLYLHGAQAAQDLIREGKIFGADGVDRQWLDLFCSTPVTEFRFLFHQKGQALVTIGAIHSVENKELQMQGTMRIREAVNTFTKYYKTYGTDPWIMMAPPRHIDFPSLPSYVNDL